MTGPLLAKEAVVAASGGLDSCVATAVAARDFAPAMLHVDYGQRTRTRERECFEAIADFYHVPAPRRLVVDLAYLARIGGSCLTDETIPVPKGGLSRPGSGVGESIRRADLAGQGPQSSRRARSER